MSRIFAGSCMLCLVILGCGGGDNDDDDSTPSTPSVTTTSPADSATDVSTSVLIEITFSEAMDAASVETALSVTPAITWTSSWTSSVLTITPGSALANDTTYVVTVASSAPSSAGVSLAAEFTFSFTTAAAIPQKGDRRLGIDVSEADGEEWIDAYDKASETGMDFLTLPINWSMIEPGPDDAFSFIPSGDTHVDQNRWNRVSTSGTFEVAGGVLHWADATAATDQPRVYTRYELTSADFEVSLDVALNTHSTGSYNMALILNFTQDGDDGNANGPTEAYVAIVSQGTGAAHYLVVTGYDGMGWTVGGAAVPQDSFALKIARSGNDFVFSYDENADDTFTTIATLDASGLSANWSNPARAYIYFDNPDTDPVDMDVDNWEIVSGDVTYDDPDDRYITGEYFDVLGIVDLVYGQQLPVEIAMSVRTINTVAVELPSDLARITVGGLVDFSDARILARYADFLAHVESRIPNVDLLSVSIGNEVDIYLGDEAPAWLDHIAFVNAAVPVAQGIFGPTVPIGVKCTFGGVENASRRPWIIEINENTDVIMLTYYPLDAGFAVRPTSEIATDFALMDTTFSGYPSKEIYILEAGVPSSPTCSSSEAIQAEFIAKLFESWDDYSTRVPAININWLTDVSGATLAEWETYYGSSDPAFLAYLGTLGLRHNDGTEKQAFQQLVDDAVSRGWVPRSPLP